MVEEDNNREYCQKLNNQREKCLDETKCRWDTDFGSRENLPSIVWFLWILINVFFIIFILIMVAYGKYVDSVAIVNLALGSFVLDIITRYIGFIMRFGGYNTLAIFFIIGGILLLLIGWIMAT